MQTEPASPANATSTRLESIDIYRGMVMFLMLAEVLHLSELQSHAEGKPDWLQRLFEWISFHTSHVEWAGCSLHDMIQPSFSFLVGTSLAFSYSKRIVSGQPWFRVWMHALWRSFALIFLGIFLRSLGRPQTNFTFDDTLTQIGLGYGFLFLCAPLSPRWIFAVCVAILVGYWAAFVAYPMPDASFAYEQVGVPAAWPEHYTGFTSHWNKNSNLAWKFDTWWMNLFPRESPFLFSAGGYCTLSFIPTLGTMLLGLIAGKWLQADVPFATRTLWLLGMGTVCMLTAWVLDHQGVCPIVKRIWTPSWTLWSGGICFAWLWGLHALCDVAHLTRWGTFWKIIGGNSIVAYAMSWTLEEPIRSAIDRHFGWLLESTASQEVQGFLVGAITLAIFWFVLRWLDRKGLHVKI